jgi:hypothetical protein
MWALAAVWHLLGNPTLGPGWAQALVAVGAGLVLWRPGSPAALTALAGGGIVLAWEEAPLLSNHWLLAAFVNLSILLAVAVSAVRRRWSDQGDLARRLFPVARLCLLGFYCFAAFAKLNSAFFDRSVSCAVFYFNESTDSVGLGALQVGGAAWLQWAVIVGTAAVELSIPVLLVLRRTRHAGVVVALVFHAVLAIDRAHQFFDFSSLLAALFVLFLPPSAGTWVAERVGSIRARLALSDERLPGLVHAGLAAGPGVAGLVVASGLVSSREALELGWWPWQLGALAGIVATARYLAQRPPAPAAGALRPHHALFALVPVLVVVNGLTPYLELKTGYGWNMYANLRTVDGDSNHFVIRRTLPLADEQADLVRVVASDDPRLAGYAERGYSLTLYQLRIYLAAHPEAALTYERGGARVEVVRAGDHPELVAPVPVWRQKLQMFRAVDERSPERCVPTFGPAR